MSRRDQLLSSACDYVIEHGLTGLSLRPLAAALGTSDRMLIYHFGSRAQLVSALIEASIDRCVEEIQKLSPARAPGEGVQVLWSALAREPLRGLEDVYIQAAAAGLLGEEPYRSAARAANERWCAALGAWFETRGVPPAQTHRVVRLVDAAFLGLHINVSTDDAADIVSAVSEVAGLVEGTI